MNLYVKLKLNRPVNKQVETVSLGSFAVIVKGVQLRFDFMDSSINIDKKNPAVIEYRGWNLDTESFPESALLEEYAEDIAELGACMVNSECIQERTLEEKPLVVVEVLSFVLSVERSEKIHGAPKESTDFMTIHSYKSGVSDGYMIDCRLRQEVLNSYNQHLKESWMVKDAEWIYLHTPNGKGITDADTILKDQIDSLEDNDYTGIFLEILQIWKKTETPYERKMVQEMFETFTGMKLVDYFEKCVKDTTK